MSTSSLVGLAWINATWKEEEGTYIDNFVPLVCEIVRKSEEDVVTEPQVLKGLEERFGLSVPQHTVGTLIRRAWSRGYLRKEDRTFRANPERLDQAEFGSRHDSVVRLYEGTIARLVDYCRNRLDLDWDSEQADAALQEYLSKYSLEVLIARDEHSPMPAPASGPSSHKVISLFITHLQDNKPGVLNIILNLFRGALLYNALFVDDPLKIEEGFGETSVYLDSPVLLHAAGYGFEAQVRPQEELVDLLQELGARVAAFRDTVEEARTILDTCASIMRHGDIDQAYDPARSMIDYFVRQGMGSSDVDRLAGRLDAKLGVLGISIDERPDYERELPLSEKDLEEYLREHIFGDREKEGVQHDVEAISNIARLRRGQPKARIAHCDAIFVTHNEGLASVSRRFFSGEELQGSVSLVITDYNMTNIAWLKRPTESPDLPYHRVMADCHAAIQPSDELWERFLGEAKRLRDQEEIEVEDYVYIRHSQEVKYALAEFTLGEVEAVTDGTVAEVLKRAERLKSREMAEAYERERKLREEREESLTERMQKDQKMLNGIAGRISKGVGWAVQAVGLVILGLGLYKLFPSDFPAVDRAFADYFWSAILLALFGFLAWSRFVGKGWLDIARRAEERTYDVLQGRLYDRWDLPLETKEGTDSDS